MGPNIFLAILILTKKKCIIASILLLHEINIVGHMDLLIFVC